MNKIKALESIINLHIENLKKQESIETNNYFNPEEFSPNPLSNYPDFDKMFDDFGSKLCADIKNIFISE